MSRVSGADTKPEITIRRLVHRMGFRYRLHVSDLPGKPDLVFARYKKVLFVHGCFWHGHHGCKRSKRPTTNRRFWNTKIEKNMARDRAVVQRLRKQGWQSFVVWECKMKNLQTLKHRLSRFLKQGR
jgi:DNA mismatch endonuclease, patch repair protein